MKPYDSVQGDEGIYAYDNLVLFSWQIKFRCKLDDNVEEEGLESCDLPEYQYLRSEGSPFARFLVILEDLVKSSAGKLWA